MVPGGAEDAGLGGPWGSLRASFAKNTRTLCSACRSTPPRSSNKYWNNSPVRKIPFSE